MSLEKYKSKRKFENTPEPKGVSIKKEEQLRFVIQKHHASHLHYDFRLEMEGVLKSWAVPKGPSTDPSIKRLAMMVEDHPYDYKDFEGVIPKGNYGAGKVIIWDEGTYEPIEEAENKKKQEKILLKQLKSGNLKIRLSGKKLNGEYALVRTKGMGENSWLLIKHKDEFASKIDITKKDKSVVSGLTVEDVQSQHKKRSSKVKDEKTQDTIPLSRDKAKQIEDQIEDDLDVKKRAKPKTVAATRKGKKQKMPMSVSPMLATLISEPFDDPDWEYEIKWDGYRAIAFMDESNVQLKSRNNKSFNDKYYPVYEALKSMNLQAVMDGEIVAVNEKGISNFGILQNWRSEADGQLLYYVFDLLWYNGKNLTDLPLSERKALLERLILDNSLVRTGFSILEKGTALFETAKKIGIEGIIAKLSKSTYTPGLRSRDWLKIKIQNRQEVVIAGYTKNEGTPRPFSALLLSVYENGSLRYAGKVGTGFNQKQQKEMLKLFKPLERKTSPLNEEPDINLPSRFRPVPPNAKATWLKPELVAEINYTEVTNDGFFRHPSFLGMRVDKDPKSIVLERKTDNEAILNEKTDNPAESIIQPPRKNNLRTLLNPKEETQVKKINGQQLKFTNLSKLYWPEEKITKRDLLNYYYQVAAYILPYLKDRPQSLNRFPNGIHGKSFYQKDITGKAPGWVKTLPYRSKDDNQEKNYLLGSDEATLLYMANLGAIEMNPWSSKMQTPDNPDWCILDLDPGSKSTFEHVIETAQVIKQVLDELNIPGYPKTSGSTGMHIYIPLNAKYTYDQSQLLAQWIASEAQAKLPDITSLERMVKKRNGKLYIDFLQNRPTATLAAPYSARPKPGATVSMPLHWNEVKTGLKTSDFNIFNAPERMQNEGDIFKPVLGKGIDLNKVIRQLEK